MTTKAHGHTIERIPLSSILHALIAIEEGGAEADLEEGFVVKIVDARVLRIEDGFAVVDMAWVRV